MHHNDKFDSPKTVNLVGYFATPFALILIVLAVVVTSADMMVKTVVFGLWGFSAFFNLAFPRFIEQETVTAKARTVKFRMYLNLTLNTLIVFLLGREFQPLWLLLALTPMATAIYGNQRRTMVNAVTASALLLGIQAIWTFGGYYPVAGPLEWAQTVTYVAFVMLMSLMINGVARQVTHPEKSS